MVPFGGTLRAYDASFTVVNLIFCPKRSNRVGLLNRVGCPEAEDREVATMPLTESIAFSASRILRPSTDRVNPPPRPSQPIAILSLCNSHSPTRRLSRYRDAE